MDCTSHMKYNTFLSKYRYACEASKLFVCNESVNKNVALLKKINGVLKNRSNIYCNIIILHLSF